MFATEELAADFKAIGLSGACLPVDLDGSNFGALWPATQAGKKLFKRRSWARADNLDRTILQVAHIPRKAKRASASLRPHAKADALNQSTNTRTHLNRRSLLNHPTLSLQTPGEAAS
jgi:hypothetical protein